MNKICFLVSGNGGSLKFINEAIKKMNLSEWCVSSVIGDRDCGAMDYARLKNIECHKVEYTREKDNELYELLCENNPDIVVTNIHRILSPKILSLVNVKFINLHYSLLPAFSGLIGMETVVKAKERNTQFLGATTHCLTEEVDQGVILGQCAFGVNWSIDYSLIVDTVFKSACHLLLNTIISNHDYEKKSQNQNFLINESYVTFSPFLVYNPGQLNEIFELIS